jgi:hypothetical protein
MAAHEDYASVANYRAKFPALFLGYLGFARYFEFFRLFHPQFVAEPRTMFCELLGFRGTQVGKLV